MSDSLVVGEALSVAVHAGIPDAVDPLGSTPPWAHPVLVDSGIR